MYSCHNTAVFIVVARAACGLQVPTLRRPQDGRKWSAGKFKDMSAHQRDEAHNGGCTPESVLNYLEIWIRRPSSIYMAFSRGLGVGHLGLVACPLKLLQGGRPTMHARTQHAHHACIGSSG